MGVTVLIDKPVETLTGTLGGAGRWSGRHGHGGSLAWWMTVESSEQAAKHSGSGSPEIGMERKVLRTTGWTEQNELGSPSDGDRP